MMMIPDPYLQYGMTPEQLHAGIAKLWSALGVEGPQEQDCFTMAAEKIVKLKSELMIRKALLDAIKTLDVELPRLTLETLVRLAYEMECFSGGRCCEILDESLQAFSERGWIQSRIRDALVEGMNRVGEHTRYGKEVAKILEEFD